MKFGEKVKTPDGVGIIIAKYVDKDKQHLGWLVSISSKDYTSEPKPPDPCVLRMYTTKELDPS